MDGYNSVVVTRSDYTPFGMPMAGRNSGMWSGYRHGFNGKEMDNQVWSTGNELDYGMRVYDPRVGRFLSVDPLTAQYPWYTPYQYAGNIPIKFVDLDGLEPAEPGSQKGEIRTGTNGSSDVAKTWKWDGKNWNENVLDEIVVTAVKKKDNSIMSRAYPHFNQITPEKTEEYNKKPKPSYYDPNPWKTVLWDATVGAFNPIKDIDIYASVSIKQKQGYSLGSKVDKLADLSRTLVVYGGQVGITTAENESGKTQGFYSNFLDFRNSYGSLKFKVARTEIRFIPLNGIGSNNNSFFGDYSPTVRSLTDFNFRGIPCQFETGMAIKNAMLNPSIGLRAKQEIQGINGWSGEAVLGGRIHLQLPPIIEIFTDQ